MGRIFKHFQKPRALDLAVLLTIVCLKCGEGANILFMHPIISYSHRQALIPLANTLADRGHKVTYFSPMRSRGEFVHPSIVDIVPPDVEKWSEKMDEDTYNIENRVKGRVTHMFESLDPLDSECCERQLKSQEFQDWLSVTHKIDLIIVDYYPNCALGLAHRYNAKVIVIHTIALWGRDVELYQLPHEAGAVPVDCSEWRGCQTPSPFVERLKAFLLPLVWRYYEWIHLDVLYRAFEEGLNMTRKDIPSLYDLQQNIALVLLTSNYVTEQAKSLPPMFVSVSGLHIREPSTLPADLQSFIDSDKESDGFVYMSLGSLVRPHNLPEETQNVILETMRSFPKLKFFWKWDGSSNDDKFKKVRNLMVKKWFPQQDLLGHPKIRGFVTQAGRPSSQEGVSFGVPMVTFAVLGDQDYNAQRLEDIGVAIQLEITTVTANQFRKALQDVVYNPKYKDNALRQTKLQMDLPMKPLDTAIWWTEYVLRHDDLSPLKPPGSQLTWYQRYWLDVFGFLFLIVVILLSALLLVVKFIFRSLDRLRQKLHLAPKTNVTDKRKLL